MNVYDLNGASFGPFPYRTCRQKIADYVSATADDPDRWIDEAPPSIAGAALFAVAPYLLSNPLMGGDAQVIHGEQAFTWHNPIPVEEDLAVTGKVAKVRRRSGVAFIIFETTLMARGGLVVEGSSTFLMSDGQAPGSRLDEGLEPEPHRRGVCDPLSPQAPPEIGGEITPVRRSASRTDLVRYAGASGDWNPVHWDHTAGVAAGLGGVVVHGLLQSAWLCGVASSHVPGSVPLSSARFRFRSPLRPGVEATVTGTVKEEGVLDLSLGVGDSALVSAVVRLRP